VLDNIELFHSHKIFIALTDLKDSDLRADLGLKVPVVENLFTELKLEWIYDNQPAAGTEKSDSQLTIGVNYSW
jgi:putative salt-induced outer membrane protein YdiY